MNELNLVTKTIVYSLFVCLFFIISWIYTDFWFQTFGLLIGFSLGLIFVRQFFFKTRKRINIILGGIVCAYLLLLGITHEIYNYVPFGEGKSIIIKNLNPSSNLSQNNSSFQYYNYSNSKIIYQDLDLDLSEIETVYSYQKFKSNSYIPLEIMELSAPDLLSFFSIFPYKKIAKVNFDSSPRFQNKLKEVSKNYEISKKIQVGGLETQMSWVNWFKSIGILLTIGLIVYLFAVIYPRKIIFKKVKPINGKFVFNKPMWSELVYSTCYFLILMYSLWLFFIADFSNEYIEKDQSSIILGWASLIFFSGVVIKKIVQQIYNINDEIIISNERIKIKNSGKFKGFKTFTKKEINTINFSDKYFSINNEEQIDYKSMNIKGYQAQIQKTIETLYNDKTINFVKED